MKSNFHKHKKGGILAALLAMAAAGPANAAMVFAFAFDNTPDATVRFSAPPLLVGGARRTEARNEAEAGAGPEGGAERGGAASSFAKASADR